MNDLLSRLKAALAFDRAGAQAFADKTFTDTEMGIRFADNFVKACKWQANRTARIEQALLECVEALSTMDSVVVTDSLDEMQGLVRSMRNLATKKLERLERAVRGEGESNG